jgi:hypothetical protein
MTRAQADNLPDPEALRAAMEPLFGELRDFMDRRIAEISAEVSASVQLLGLDQDNLAGQISGDPGNRGRGQYYFRSGRGHSGLA